VELPSPRRVEQQKLSDERVSDVFRRHPTKLKRSQIVAGDLRDDVELVGVLLGCQAVGNVRVRPDELRRGGLGHSRERAVVAGLGREERCSEDPGDS
jgi:hypothetical protein